MTFSTSTPQRLYLMQVAALPAPINTPAVCYLVQTDDGTNILIDTGIPDLEMLRTSMPDLIAYPNVIEQLALLKLQPKDIDLLICTHFDLDHVGHHAAFQHAPFVVQRAQLEAARREPRFVRTRPLWDLSAVQYQVVDGDAELLPGLELLDTSRHVPGHQSVLVRLPEMGAVLLAIDAVPDQNSFTQDRIAGPRDLDAEGVRTSTHKLLELVEREHVSLVIFGHDGQQWQTLKKLPGFYG
jgi:N-acyl homoserine lactone hydrolase